MKNQYYLYILLIIISIIIFKKIIINRENMEIKSNYDINTNILFSSDPYILQCIKKICNLPCE